MPTPALGRNVLYCLNNGQNRGQERAARICRIWSDTCVNLRVDLDGENDVPNADWVTSVNENAGVEPVPGMWRWPPKV